MQHNHIALPPSASQPGAPAMFQQAFPAQAQQRGIAPPMQPQLTLAAVGAPGVTVPASAPAVTLMGTVQPPPATAMTTIPQDNAPPAPPALPARETHQDSNGNSVYRGRWTPDEDRMLRYAVDLHDGKNWKSIAAHLESRTDVQCLHRWQKVLRPGLIKGPWTKDEDEAVKKLVAEFGCKRWSLIASHLEGRLGKQCRERWYNHLNPSIRKDAWTVPEDLRIIRLHAQLGNKWAEISRSLKGRTDNSIKNRWNSTLNRLLKQAAAAVEARVEAVRAGKPDPAIASAAEARAAAAAAAAAKAKSKAGGTVPPRDTSGTLPDGTPSEPILTEMPPVPEGELSEDQKLDLAVAHLQVHRMLGEGSRRRRGSGRARKKKGKKKGKAGQARGRGKASAAAGAGDTPPPASERGSLSTPVVPGAGRDIIGAAGHPLSVPHNAKATVQNPNPASHPAFSAVGLAATFGGRGLKGSPAPRRMRSSFLFASPPVLKPSTQFRAPTPAAAPSSISTPGMTNWPFSSPGLNSFTPSALFSTNITPSQLALTPVSLQPQTPSLTPAGLLMTEPLGSPNDGSMLESPSVLIEGVRSAQSSVVNVSAAQDLLGFAHANTPEPVSVKDMLQTGANGKPSTGAERVARHLSFAGDHVDENGRHTAASDGMRVPMKEMPSSPAASSALAAAVRGMSAESPEFPTSPKAMAALALHQLATPTSDYKSPRIPGSLSEFEQGLPLPLSSPSPGYPSPNILRRKKMARRATRGRGSTRGGVLGALASPGRPMIRIKRSSLSSSAAAPVEGAGPRARKRMRLVH